MTINCGIQLTSIVTIVTVVMKLLHNIIANVCIYDLPDMSALVLGPVHIHIRQITPTHIYMHLAS